MTDPKMTLHDWPTAMMDGVQPPTEADVRTCTVAVAADPYNGDACGEDAAGVRHEPTCAAHLDYHEVFLHDPVWRADTDGWDPIDDATVFLRQRNVAIEMLREATGRSLGDVLRAVRQAEEASRG